MSDKLTPQEITNAVAIFEADDEYCFCQDNDDSEWYVPLNDTWYYASADGEDIPLDQYKIVADLYRQYGRCGVLYWVHGVRKTLPQIPSQRRMVEMVVAREEEFAVERAEWKKKLDAYQAEHPMPVAKT